MQYSTRSIDVLRRTKSKVSEDPAFKSADLFEHCKVKGTRLIPDVVIDCWRAVVLSGPRVEQAETLHVHGVNSVSNGLIEIPRQIVRGVQLATRRLSCSRAAEKSSYQQIEHRDDFTLRILLRAREKTSTEKLRNV